MQRELRASAATAPRLSPLSIALTLLLLLPAVAVTASEAAYVSGDHGAVAAEHALASEAGVEILRAGGNAVDAAVAASLATAVVNPSSSGLGGGGFMIIYLAEEGRAHALDYRETAPAAAQRDMYIRGGKPDPQASRRGGLAVAVPGEAAGLELALTRFGTMSMAAVAAPALRLATEGFTVAPHLADAIASNKEALAGNPELARVFLRNDGAPYQAGDHMWRSGLASSLQRLASEGAATFYRGEIAHEIAAAVEATGGVLTEDDLAAYKPVQRQPLLVDFKSLKLITMPPPSSGGAVMAEALAVLAPYDLRALGWNSPTYLHLLAEVLKAVFADRAIYYGDPGFVDIPLRRLLSPAHAADIRNGLSAVRTVPASRYGEVAPPPPDSGTSHISVIDAAGNAVACTTSINTAFGAMVGVPGRGIPLNNTMDDFSIRPGVANSFGLLGSEANSIAPGKRPLSSMSPTVVLRNGRARLVVGASGGPLIITATLQTLLDVAEFNMDVGAAVDAPRIHHQWLPEMLGVEQGIPETLRTSLTRRGHQVAVLPRGAAVEAVESLTVDGKRTVRAASDPRKGGVAAAY